MADSQRKEILIRYDQQIVWIQFNRPEVRNALNSNILDQLIQTLMSVSKSIQMVVISGDQAAFSSGMDLNEYRSQKTSDPAATPSVQKKIGALLDTIYNHHALMIACVEGVMCGGGLGVASCCDLVLATPSACGMLPELKHGILPKEIMPFLKKRIKKQTILRWVMDGGLIRLNELLEEGVVDRAFESRASIEHWLGCFLKVLDKSPYTLREVKALVLSG